MKAYQFKQEETVFWELALTYKGIRTYWPLTNIDSLISSLHQSQFAIQQFKTCLRYYLRFAQ